METVDFLRPDAADNSPVSAPFPDSSFEETFGKEGICPFRMEYLQEMQKYSGFFHILCTGGNAAAERPSGFIHSFHRPYCYYEWYNIYYIYLLH